MTNGVLSILEHGKMAMKIVCGCDGYNAPILKRTIEKLGRVPSPTEAYDLAWHDGVGCDDCLLIVTPDEVWYHRHKLDRLETADGESLALYRATFNDPQFNPRWKQGLADYVEVIESLP